MIRYSWSGWRLSQSSNRITAWWMAAIRDRYFVSMVGVNPVEPSEYHKDSEFDIRGCLTLEDFHDRSSAFLMGGPTEVDLNIAFASEKKTALEKLEQFMTVAWMEPTKDQVGEAVKNGGAYATYGVYARDLSLGRLQEGNSILEKVENAYKKAWTGWITSDMLKGIEK